MTYVGKKPADIIATAVDTTTGTFSGDLTVDTNTLYVDSANNRVGVGTSSPSHLLHLYSADARSPSILLENNSAGDSDVGITFAENSENYAYRIGTDDSGNTFRITYKSGGIDPLPGTDDDRLVIDASGNVGIGTDSPAEKVDIAGNDANAVSLQIVNSETASASVLLGQAGSSGYGVTSWGSSVGILDGTNGLAIGSADPSAPLLFYTSNTRTERARIDSSGNLIVGKTAESGNTAGHFFSPSGYQRSTRNGGIHIMNRITTDGSIIDFQKDGSAVGSIGSNSGAYIYIGSDSVQETYIGFNNNYVYPSDNDGNFKDNAIDLGNASARFNDIYLGGGVYLGGTGSANYLDDYEEGTWTPQAGSESGVFTAGYAGQAGYYTKIGNRVIATFDITLSSRTLSGAIAFLYGLPFAVRNNGDLSGSFGNIATTNNKGANFYQISIYAQNNASYCYLTSTSSNTAELGPIANTFWGASTRLAGGVIYNTV